MLRELLIRNFAIVDRLEVEFRDGLNVITGETGAGKSILVNALKLLSGGRVSAEYIKTGSDSFEIQAIFDTTVPEHLKEKDIVAEDDEIIIRRTFSKNGKGRIFINESFVTLNLLGSVGEELFEIHSQHDHQKLFSPSNQRDLLDRFGNLSPLVGEVKKLYEEKVSLQEELEQIRSRSRERMQRIDLLRFQVDEINAARLDPDEYEGLLAERKKLQNLQRLRTITEEVILKLKEGDTNVMDSLSECISSMEELFSIDETVGEPLRLLREAGALLEESLYSIREIKDGYELDPGRIDEVEERLHLIEKLQRKYGETINEIITYGKKAEDELEDLINLSEKTSELEDALKTLTQKLDTTSDKLSEKRKKTARELEELIIAELKALAFSKPKFKIRLKELSTGPHGKDSVEFLFSANPGEPPRPLNKVASGGELSRVMLALKSVFAGLTGHEILVFDEIDAGIGGETADRVGERLKRLAEDHQVICITHLPQIASRADWHLVISKSDRGDRTSVNIRPVEGNDRKEEIARMMSGEITGSSLHHAEELLQKSLQGDRP